MKSSHACMHGHRHTPLVTLPRLLATFRSPTTAHTQILRTMDSYKTGAISALFTEGKSVSSSSSSCSSSGGLSNLFSEGNQKRFKRIVKPQEFEPKKKAKRDQNGRVKLRKEGDNVSNQGKKRKEDSRNVSEGVESMDALEVIEHGVNDGKESDPEPRTIFVGNIPLTANAQLLKRFFKEYGEVESLRLRSVPIAGVAVDDHGNQDLVRKVCTNSRRFGDQKGSFNAYIVFKNVDAATSALAANNRIMDKRHLRVDRASPSLFDPKMTAFLGGLPHYADEEELRAHFAKTLPNGHDDIENLRLIRDPETLIGKGIGYLLLKNQDALLRLLQTNEKFKKREIRISTCGKRTKRTEKRKQV